MSRLCAAFALLFLCLHEKGISCGYNFVGDCSTNISLKINGIKDSFAVASCSSRLKFDGFSFGSLQSLELVRATGTTWESCQNNVSSMELRYRVYPQNNPGGAWQSLALQQDYFTLEGPYTTRYRSGNTGVSLTAGLTAGETYVLEIYFRAEVDTIGDDFIPETTLLQNNNGQNYRLTFQYGGASAPPFLVVATKAVDTKCHGDSTGVAGVTVYGNQSGLFYQWSTGGNNFYILSKIPAGTYSVTVTGAGGYSASDTIAIGQPDPLQVQFAVTGPGCDGAPASALAAPSGGTAPYYYLWENGQQTPGAGFAEGGSYALTLTDKKACSAVFTANVPEQPVVEQQISAVICLGEVYAAGNMSLTSAGTYSYQLDGFPDCDTLVHLQLDVLNPAAALQGLPETAIVTCTMPALDLCATPGAGISFQWTQNGIPTLTSPCLPVTAGGQYAVVAISTAQQKTCSAEKSIEIEEHLLPPALSYSGAVEELIGCVPPDSVHLVLAAQTDAEAPAFQWSLDGVIVSSGDSCLLHVPFSFIGKLPVLAVSDAWGCAASVDSGLVSMVLSTATPVVDALTENPWGGFDNGAISLNISGGVAPYSVLWNTGDTTVSIAELPSGTYCATVTDALGCADVSCHTLMSSGVDERPGDVFVAINPNPVVPGNEVQIILPENFQGEELRLEILDWRGRALMRHIATAASGRMFVEIPASLPAGLLVFRLNDENGHVATGKAALVR